ncbi:MAG: 6-carboxytetrahydropterin synthase QueD [Caldithrix sp.]|nr:6-carboxytetrahydropterin synthase QueD [Caldithrix sp.]
MYTLSIETSIAGAHYLNDYQGACARLHGHNWKIKVEVSSGILDDIGMVIDFKDLKDIADSVIMPFDHQTFNDISPFDQMNPTAENLARYFFREIGRRLPQHVHMSKIYLWETEKYLVEYTE